MEKSVTCVQQQNHVCRLQDAHTTFLIRAPGAVLSPETFDGSLQIHTQHHLQKSLLQLTQGVHTHLVSISSNWEKNMKDNYTNTLHGLLAHLTDVLYTEEGSTVLYIPLEGLQRSPEEASRDKKLVQRMENVSVVFQMCLWCSRCVCAVSDVSVLFQMYVSVLFQMCLCCSRCVCGVPDVSLVFQMYVSVVFQIYVSVLFQMYLCCSRCVCVPDVSVVFQMYVVIHWTDQIKRLLNAEEVTIVSGSCGPLQEIQMWRSRAEKLLDMSRQLQKPEVQHIQDVLLLSKSLYAQRFCKLALQIQTSSVQAQSNLSFLSVLESPCAELSSLSPRQVPPKLQNIIHLIHLIWLHSDYYNTSERITGLFHKVSPCEHHGPLPQAPRTITTVTRRRASEEVGVSETFGEMEL
uniref:Dynein heavy chain tail domain-containing protein n=1 Tax=Knipowitschia caucasica TaxID=637954 RepID=A0AAV2KJV7_KNICA